MAYSKQNFEDGQVLTAQHLNHIEDGIKDALCVNVSCPNGEDEPLSADHTAAEIYEAHTAGRYVYLIYEGEMYYPAAIYSEEIAIFETLDGAMAKSIWFEGDVISVDSDAENIYAKTTDVYSKEEIDAIMGSYISDIDTLIGGEG